MRLRNKKTGVIGEVGYISTSTGDILVSNIHDQEEWYHHKSLAEFNAEWEDAPEEAIRVYIEGIQNVYMGGGRVYIDYASAQEAEKAVEKLKAWKRLKDKGVEFYGWRRNHTGTYDLLVRWKDRIPRSYEVKKDLDLLFGGEECLI